MTPRIRGDLTLSDQTRRGALLVLILAAGVGAGLLLSPAVNPDTRPREPVADTTIAATAKPTMGPVAKISTAAGGVDRTSPTRDGAVAAAAQYASLLAQVWPLSAAQARTTLADAATTAYQPRLVAAVSAQLVPMQAQATSLGGRTIYRQSVLATHLDTYPTTTATSTPPTEVARVSVWTVLTIAHTGPATDADPVNANAVFFTSQLDLLYERGAWRLCASTDHAGPTPLVEGTPSTGTQMARQLNGFHDWRPQ